MKIADLRAKSKEELKDLVVSLKQEQFNLRFQEATGALENKGRYKDTRRTIARAMTLLSETPKAEKAAKAPKAAKNETAAPAKKKTAKAKKEA